MVVDHDVQLPRMLAGILLVIGLGREESAMRDPGRNRRLVALTLAELGDEAPGLRFLPRILREDRAAVAGADIWTLAIDLGGIVRDRKIDLQQLRVTDPTWVVGDAHRLG